MLYFWNKYTLPPLHQMTKGNYLVQHEETAGGNLCYIDYKRKTLLSAFCVLGNFPTPAITEKRWSKEVEMFLIDYGVHQSLCELVSTG